MNPGKKVFSILCTLIFLPFLVVAQNTYEEYAYRYKDYDFDKRTAPVLPPKGERIKVIIDADAKNEIDDQWALALALLSPERFNILGIVGTTFAWGGPASVEMSVKEIDTILHLTELADKIPVFPGSQPLQYRYTPNQSDGVDFIIDQAMKASKEDPIWVIGLGAATNMASAYLKQPEIAERVVVFWHLRTRWPEKCWNFNVFGDPHAARLLFDSPMKFVLFDTGTYLTCSMQESEEKIKPYGKLGAYLHNIRLGNDWYMSDTKGFFDLGDVAAMLDPEVAYYEEVSCPEVDHDLSYRFNNSRGKILRIYHVDRDKTFQLLYDKLAGVE
jgi:inosine-uridine nucleoside N-ribohydrolase